MIKKSLLLLSLIAAAVSFSSCATKGKTEGKTAVSSPVISYTLNDFYSFVPEKESENITIAATLNAKFGDNVTAMINGGTPAKNPAPVPSQLGESVVTTNRRYYYYDGEERTVTFEIVYSNVKAKDIPENTVLESTDVIGTVCAESASIVFRSEKLEPYLTSVSNYKPDYVDGYWYYYPGILDSREVKWLDFFPPNEEELVELYDHATDIYKETLGATFGFYFPNLYETTLPVYPFLQEDGTSLLGIDYYGCNMLLYFQQGFYDYLQKEYTLGDKIYLLLQITEFTAGPEDGTLAYVGYVRDYSLISPTEMVWKNFTYIKNSYKK